jgi:hypothetical protein
MPIKEIEKRRAYQREYKRKWYQENKKKHIEYVQNHDGRVQKWFQEYKKTLFCEICRENHPACLEFHHIGPASKSFSVSSRRNRPSMEALLEEIAKSRVLCANCHRKEHWEMRERERQKNKVAD